RHAKTRGSKIVFRFRGKSGRDHEIDLNDAKLAGIVRQCQHVPQQELFAYVDADGRKCDVKSGDVNDYLRKISGDDFTAKDFRTWFGTMLAAKALRKLDRSDSKTAANRNVKAAVKEVADRLGNTPAVCRKGYIHPRVIESYLDGTLASSRFRHITE